MDLRLFVALVVGKTLNSVIKFLHFGAGQSAPGLYALKIEPKLVEKLSKLAKTRVIITGTNGKTTTTRFLADAIVRHKLSLISNPTGSNLERGIASAMISQIPLFGGKFDIAVWEVDEAAFNKLAGQIKPDLVVFLNCFRDQLDRYGEVNRITGDWVQTLNKLRTKPKLILNGDDPTIRNLDLKPSWKKSYFSVKGAKILHESTKISFKKLDARSAIIAQNIVQRDLLGSTFEMVTGKVKFEVNLPIPGIFNIYNFLAAYSVGVALGLDARKLVDTSQFQRVFGRFEQIRVNNKQVVISLIKNPTGANAVLETILPNLENSQLLLILNDNFADGRDVSWIWDANFEILKDCRSEILVSGSRAYDLGLRLKYAGISLNRIHIEPSTELLISEVLASKHDVFVIPTYTALLFLQKQLQKAGIKTHDWQEI